MASPDLDVAIVGYGPVGGLAALLLADAGLRVAVVERETGVVDLPRAVGLDGEIVRAFQRMGCGEEIAAITQPPREGEELAFTDSRRKPYFTTSFPPVGHNGWRDIAFFDQPELEAKIRELVARQGRAEVRLGEEVTGIVPGDEDVTLTTRTASSRREDLLRASCVIACDGASSFVRQALGIGWQSLGYDQDWLVVDVVIEDEADLPTATLQVCDPVRLTTYVCGKDPNRRWEFQLRPGETREEMLRPERVRALLDPWLPACRYRLRRAAVYQFHAATAERWREGRVFLAGDAAHQTPPFLGQGLNTGFRDVVNLAWKLPRVLDGTCGPALLDTYESERDPHARDLVDWAVAVGRLMESFQAAEAGWPPPREADRRSGYGQGRAAPPLQAGVIATEQGGPGSSTGFPLRQPTVRTPEGVVCRLDALLGPGFAVVGRDEEALALSSNSRRLLERIGGRTVSLAGLEVLEGAHDRLFAAHPAAVVRPDRYVFGTTGEGWSLDRLLACLEHRLALRQPGGGPPAHPTGHR